MSMKRPRKSLAVRTERSRKRMGGSIQQEMNILAIKLAEKERRLHQIDKSVRTPEVNKACSFFDQSSLWLFSESCASINDCIRG